MRLIIVRRGALSTFRFLEQSCRDVPGLRVIWDRRRGSPSLCGADRRGEAPHSWTAADHVFARVDDVPPCEVNPPVAVGVDDTNGEKRI
jgi:hypothetical protein